MKRFPFLTVMVICFFLLIGLASLASADSYLACDKAPVPMLSAEVRINGIVYSGMLESDQPPNTPQGVYLLYNVTGLPTWTLHIFNARWSNVAGATGAEWSSWSDPFAHTERAAPGGLRIMEF